MVTLRGAAYPHSRLAAVRFLRGDLLGAIEEMERGVEALLAGKAPRENIACGETRLGEFFFLAGQVDDGEPPTGRPCRDPSNSLLMYHPMGGFMGEGTAPGNPSPIPTFPPDFHVNSQQIPVNWSQRACSRTR